MGFFDKIKDVFDSIFGNKEIDIFSWDGEQENTDGMQWMPDGEYGGDFSQASSLEERLIDDHTGGEFVQEFYDLQGALDYVEGTPENVLMLMLDPENNTYYVYRFASE